MLQDFSVSLTEDKIVKKYISMLLPVSLLLAVCAVYLVKVTSGTAWSSGGKGSFLRFGKLVLLRRNKSRLYDNARRTIFNR